MSKYTDFKSKVLGKAYDIDGYYGAQCWDGAMYWSQYLGYPTFHCTRTGYAQDIWTLRNSSGILNYYDEVTQLQPGDIVVFQKSSETPYSHIAIFDSDAGNGNKGNFLGQNQGGVNGAFNIVTLNCNYSFPTAFRPKCLSSSSNQSGTIGNTNHNQYYGNIQAKNDSGIYYQAHVQDYGWREPVHDGQIIGSSGESRRMEAMRIDLRRLNGALELDVDVHLQNIGWKTFENVQPGTIIGTVGESRRLEAVRIRCRKNTTGKKLKYQAHLQDIGWADVVGEGQQAGTTGQSRRMEALKIWIE